MWVIRNLSKQFFSDWSIGAEPVPVWSTGDEKSPPIFQYPTKELALDAVRAGIERDQTADPPRYPVFTGCRVIEYRMHVLSLMKKQGIRVSPYEDGILVEYDERIMKPSKARELYGHERMGVPIYLKTADGKMVE